VVGQIRRDGGKVAESEPLELFVELLGVSKVRLGNRAEIVER
jgi:hypothetical protein